MCGACQNLKARLQELGMDFEALDGRLLSGEIGYTEAAAHVLPILLRVQVARVWQDEDWPPPMPVLVVGERVCFTEDEIEEALS